MFTTQPLKLHNRTALRRTQRGQSIVIALLVLLLLGLAGALFVTIVARNLVNAAHGARVQTADSYARAGLTYADAQLSGSVDGADWRPTLQVAALDGTSGATDYRPGVGPAGPAYPNGSTVSTGDSRERKRYKSQVYDPTNNPNGILKPVNPNDPDATYLAAGYARYNTGAGRFLVRVTYDPVSVTQGVVPSGKYLKIESIGREGVIDPLDPTTFGNNRSSDRTQAYQVAYVPIGITDYARFETNPDKRSDIANLGVSSQFYAQNTDGGIATPGVSDFNSTGSSNAPPTIQEYPVLTTYGAPDAYLYPSGTSGPLRINPAAGSGVALPPGYSSLPGGGSIHSNMPVRFFGTNLIYLNAGTDSPLFQDTAEIGGDLLLDTYDQKAALDNSTLDRSGTNPVGQQAALILNPVDLSKLTAAPIAAKPVMLNPPAAPAMPPYNTYISPSNASGITPAFSTQNGLIRDGSMQNDGAGLPRSITRIDPPALDAQDAASQMPRYRAIAMNSAPRPNLTNPDGTAYTPGSGALSPSLYGYGKAIYVNNPNDVQPESASIGGGSTLTDEWLHRTSASATAANKGGWNGLFYNPPGVTIVLGQFLPTTPANGAVPASPAGPGIRLIRTVGDSFVGPDGKLPAGAEMNVKYSALDTDTTGAASDNDIVIYAEGNVRVRGILSPDESASPIQFGAGRKTKTVPRHITIVTGGTAYIEGNLLKGDPDSSISVLAHDYVCINTTQFLAGANVEDRTDGSQNPDLPDRGDTLSLDAGHSLLQEFNFGLTGTATPAKYNSLALYVSAGPSSAGSTTANFDILDPTGNSVFPAQPPPAPAFSQIFTTGTHLTFDLSTRVTQPTTTNPLFDALGTDTFQLSVSKATGLENGANTDQDVALERVAVLPMDIRIEAVLYAQTRSFFVIPGEWFNTNAADNISEYLRVGVRQDLQGPNASVLSAAQAQDRSRFPLYGQPVDLKITISGSVSEAQPADIAAQTAWMQKWGWIPQYHGSLVTSSPNGTPGPEAAGHTTAGQPAIGLQIIYDPQAGYPYDPMPAAPNGTTPYYLRSDKYGRPLPFTPKLPVSTGLLYSGQSGEAPLLQ